MCSRVFFPGKPGQWCLRGCLCVTRTDACGILYIAARLQIIVISRFLK